MMKTCRSEISEVALKFNNQAKSILENNTSDSDDLFTCIKLSNNIDFSRTKTQFLDGINILSPSLLFGITDKSIKTEKENTNPSISSETSNIYFLDSGPKSINDKCETETYELGKGSSIMKNNTSQNLTKESTEDQRKRSRIHRSVSAGKNSLGGLHLHKSSMNSSCLRFNTLSLKKIVSPNRRKTCSKMASHFPSSRPGTPLPLNKVLPRQSSRTNSSVSVSNSNIRDSLKPISLIRPIADMSLDSSENSSIQGIETPKNVNINVDTSNYLQQKISSIKGHKGDISTNHTVLKSVGVQDLASKATSSEMKQMRPTVKNVHSEKPISFYDDEDLPLTQPISSIILRGVVAYVEIRFGREYRNSGTKAELESLGAKVENNFTKKVTHCIFHSGKMSTFCRAVDWKIPLVTTLWIEACKKELGVVPVKGYEPHNIAKYKEELTLYRLRSRIRRPVTDSKVRFRNQRAISDTAARQEDDSGNREKGISAHRKISTEKNYEIDTLHSVADDIKSASLNFKTILTSPILQKRDKPDKDGNSNALNMTKDKTNLGKNKKRNKKLSFTDQKCEKSDSSNINLSNTNDSNKEIRISYDSDDLLSYAKKQAAISRCSAPGRLLTSRKCKKLLSSSQKTTEVAGKENKVTSQNSQDTQTNRKKKPVQSSKNTGNSDSHGKQKDSDKTAKPKPRKRKLLLNVQEINSLDQDSNESNNEMTPPCPYTSSPRKRQKTGPASKTVKAKLLPIAPVWSDLDSDDSATRSSRRESSALFVKKDKPSQQRNLPSTVVCTSLHRSDVDVVNSIVARLGRFSAEGAVSERTTHVLTNCPRRTLNIVKGIARGCWVLNVKWVYDSLEAGRWLPEERFEFVEFSPSVKMARVERQAFGPEFGLELFRGVGPVYVCRSTTPPTADLVELLRLCGATVVSSARVARIVVGGALAQVFSPPYSQAPLVVREKWVLDCITRLTLIDPQGYVVDESSTA